jgi:hypothetical protein
MLPESLIGKSSQYPCVHPHSIKNGFTNSGKQRWKCTICHKSFTFDSPYLGPEEIKIILKNRDRVLHKRVRNKVIDERIREKCEAYDKLPIQTKIAVQVNGVKLLADYRTKMEILENEQ